MGAGRADDPVEFSAQELFHDAKQLIGSYYGSADMQRDVPELISLWRTGRFDLASMVDDVVDLAKINDVVSAQRSGTSLRTMVSI